MSFSRASVLETLITAQTRLVLQTASYRRQKRSTQTDTETSTPCSALPAPSTRTSRRGMSRPSPTWRPCVSLRCFLLPQGAKRGRTTLYIQAQDQPGLHLALFYVSLVSFLTPRPCSIFVSCLFLHLARVLFFSRVFTGSKASSQSTVHSSPGSTGRRPSAPHRSSAPTPSVAPPSQGQANKARLRHLLLLHETRRPHACQPGTRF